jgi:hypothetical protein
MHSRREGPTESILDFTEKNNPEKDNLAVLQHISDRKSAKTSFPLTEMEEKLMDSLCFIDPIRGQDMLRSFLLPVCCETRKEARRSAGYASETWPGMS